LAEVFGIFPTVFIHDDDYLAALTNGYRVEFLPINYYKQPGNHLSSRSETLGFILLIIA
jgi:hypothetical protein